MKRSRKSVGFAILAVLSLCFLLCFLPNATQAAFPACVPPPSGLIHWWPGEGDAADIAGNNDGTLLNGVTFAPGMVGQAFSFDGVNDNISAPSLSSSEVTTQVSVDAWVFSAGGEHYYQGVISTKPGDIALRMTRQSDDMSTALGCPNTHALFFQVVTEMGYKEAKACFTKNVWHHVAGTYDGTSVRLYIDGHLVTSPSGVVSETPHSGMLSMATPVFIGSYKEGGEVGQGAELWSGLIDEVEIFNRALDASEILAIFNAGSAGKCKAPDTDGDGIIDTEDSCPSSNLSATVVIDGCDSHVLNTLFPNGCTISDSIQQCAEGAKNHGQFVSCVSHFTNKLKKMGVITGRQHGAIQSCAAKDGAP
jgi:hypothetical protein